MSGQHRSGLPTVAGVFDHAVEHIVLAAGQLWPGEPVLLGEQVPSVTSYVHRMRVGERSLYAKYSLLGSSLVSLLRGAHGAWDAVLAAQQGYVQRRDALLLREARQLHLLGQRRQIAVCELAGYHSGVLFTEAVDTGSTLAELLLAKPHQAAELLRRAWVPLNRVHRTPFDGWPLIAERDIVATFTRKFEGGQRSTVHFGQHIRHGINADVVEGLQFVVRRLRTIPATRPTSTLVFGEVKPEHIIMAGSHVLYLDPGMHVSSVIADLAKLVSRLLLVVMSQVSATDARRKLVAGITDLIREERSTAALASSEAWMVELLTFVARDAANIITTYLTAPERLPLPRSATAILEHADAVVSAIEHIVTGLVQRKKPVEIWARTTAEVVGA